MRRSTQQEKAVRDIIRLAPLTEIIRHTHGKVHLKYSMRALMRARDIDFDNLARSLPGLIHTQIKAFSKTIIISYDPEYLAADLWDDLNRIKTKPELALRVAERLEGLLACNKTA
jgi:hypothetical protein